MLTQIIVEQEQKGQNLLPISFLRQLITFYGNNMQFLVPGYLEQAMGSFARNQDQIRDSLRATFGYFPFGPLEEISKQNMALYEQALKMMSPFGLGGAAEKAAPAQPTPAAEPDEDPRLKRMEAQMEAMRRQLETGVEERFVKAGMGAMRSSRRGLRPYPAG